MRQYLANVWLWLRGFALLGTVPLKAGWRNGPAWWAVYAVDYGAACIFLAVGVQPISRWAGERAKHAPWRQLAALLNRLDAQHTSSAGGLLWGSQPCPPRVRYAVAGAWAGLVLGGALVLLS